MTRQILESFVLGGRIGQPFGNHGVKGDGRDAQVVAVQNGVIILGVVGYLANFGVGEGGAQCIEHGLQRELPFCQLWLSGKEGHLPGAALCLIGQMPHGDVVADRWLYGDADAH